ncbi:hemolytic protein HlpA [Microcystis aeruginosa]|jgi:hypothetical protein|uniref:hemolytic protein HlpA n=1 Tax=Microcystis aeruginosa TaxID=1126 RepID=UPI000469AF8A|nr:hemolytic protein HlpA [Microcystis aeruginosa]MDB9395286.1 glycosyltransferase family 2 protein [Microcystis aeruginosa CS-573]
MNDFQLTTPVAFLIFNRPDTTARVFEAIRQAKPPKLLVVADGPRADRPDDLEKCKAARAIIEGVDWDCEVLKNYSDVNLGCGRRPATGITWVFEQVEEAIILEDDILPNLAFFQFCDILLEKYRDDKRVMMISGENWLGEWKSNIQSYHFSCYGDMWGWASWRRAWQYFDYDMKLWVESEVRERIRDVLAGDEQFRIREKIFWEAYHEKDTINAWSYQWSFARLLYSGLSIIPSVNLILNIGFGKDATHTFDASVIDNSRCQYEMNFPLKEPYGLAVDREYDRLYFKSAMKPSKNYLKRIINKLRENITRPV